MSWEYRTPSDFHTLCLLHPLPQGVAGVPSSSPNPPLSWPTMNLMSSSRLLEENLSLKVSDPFPKRSQPLKLLLGLSKLLYSSSSCHLPPAPASRLHSERNAWQTGHWHHGQLCESAHSGRSTGARDQRCGPDLQPELLPEPAQSHRSGPSPRDSPPPA